MHTNIEFKGITSFHYNLKKVESKHQLSTIFVSSVTFFQERVWRRLSKQIMCVVFLNKHNYLPSYCIFQELINILVEVINGCTLALVASGNRKWILQGFMNIAITKNVFIVFVELRHSRRIFYINITKCPKKLLFRNNHVVCMNDYVMLLLPI